MILMHICAHLGLTTRGRMRLPPKLPTELANLISTDLESPGGLCIFPAVTLPGPPQSSSRQGLSQGSQGPEWEHLLHFFPLLKSSSGEGWALTPKLFPAAQHQLLSDVIGIGRFYKGRCYTLNEILFHILISLEERHSLKPQFSG